MGNSTNAPAFHPPLSLPSTHSQKLNTTYPGAPISLYNAIVDLPETLYMASCEPNTRCVCFLSSPFTLLFQTKSHCSYVDLSTHSSQSHLFTGDIPLWWHYIILEGPPCSLLGLLQQRWEQRMWICLCLNPPNLPKPIYTPITHQLKTSSVPLAPMDSLPIKYRLTIRSSPCFISSHMRKL